MSVLNKDIQEIFWEGQYYALLTLLNDFFLSNGFIYLILTYLLLSPIEIVGFICLG